jgi:hypothetical protein
MKVQPVLSHVTCPFHLWLPSLLLRLCLPSFFSDVPSPSASSTVYHGYFHFIFCFSACMIHERATSPESHVTCLFRLWLLSLLLWLCLPSFFSDVPSPSASPTVYHGYGSAPRVPLNLYLSVRPLPPTILNSNLGHCRLR